MADIMSFSPLWNEWHIKECIGKGSFGAVYKAEKYEYGNHYYSAIKHISIPPENVTMESLAADGVAINEKSFSTYCDNLRDQFIKEINFCYALRGNTNIVSYEDHCIIPKRNGAGYDIFIRMELLTGLTSYMVKHPLSEKEVIRLGMELCDALSVLEMNHMIHRDIKPANIFVNSQGVFKLGDFGESKVLSNSTMGMTIRGTYSYMSPEISRGEPANITADIYSLGLVLYRLLNGNRAPFLPLNSLPVSSSETENANIRRLKGEPLPPPAYCSTPALSDIIMRACAYKKENRWQSPMQMKQALSAVLNGQTAQNAAFRPQPADSVQPSRPVYPVQPPVVQQPAAQPAPKSKKGLIIGISAAVIALAVIIIIAVAAGGSSSGSKSTVDTSGGSSSVQESSSSSYVSASDKEIVGTWTCTPEAGYTLIKYREQLIFSSDHTAYYCSKQTSSSENQVSGPMTWTISGSSVIVGSGSYSLTLSIIDGKLYIPDQSASHFEKTSTSTYIPS